MKASAVRYRLAVWLSALAVLAGCATSTPAPTPTTEPTFTPIPSPTRTPTATSTSVPEPSLGHLMFATAEDMAGAKASHLTFDAGPEAMYVSFDYAGIPADADLHIELARNDVTLAETEATWDQGPAGTAVWLLSDEPGDLLAGMYDVDVTLAGERLSGEFLLSATDGEPGARLIIESFEDNRLDWNEYNRTTSSVKIEDGRVLVSEQQANFFNWASLPLDFEDFDLSVDAWQEDGPANGYYGILVRDSGRGAYMFSVSIAGVAGVARLGNEPEVLLSARRSSALHLGQEINQLRVVARGDTFAFYANDTLIGNVTDGTLRRGAIGLVSGSFDTPGMVAAFDNLVINLPSDEAVEVVPAPAVTAGPRATAAPTTPATSPLLDAVRQTLDHVHLMGGSMDRIYDRGGAEACGPFLSDFYAAINSPGYDVAGQSNTIQGAYGLYREAIAIVVEQVGVIRDECETGDGLVEPFVFGAARTAINTAGDRLETALRLLTGQQ